MESTAGRRPAADCSVTRAARLPSSAVAAPGTAPVSPQPPALLAAGTVPDLRGTADDRPWPPVLPPGETTTAPI
jgi:hypothetical protein